MSFKEIQDFLRCLLEVLSFGASQVVLGAIVFLAADRFLFFLFESNKVNIGFVNREAGLDATLSFLTSNVSLISTTPILPLRSSAVDFDNLEEFEQKQASHEVISQPSYSDVRDEEIQHTTEFTVVIGLICDDCHGEWWLTVVTMGVGDEGCGGRW
nr:hypothetical protein [Tanacetum cinerariifolium]